MPPARSSELTEIRAWDDSDAFTSHSHKCAEEQRAGGTYCTVRVAAPLDQPWTALAVTVATVSRVPAIAVVVHDRVTSLVMPSVVESESVPDAVKARVS
ncbi:MAG: hypothetical protein WDO69_14360 [Pseudomonadota bacterium]